MLKRRNFIKLGLGATAASTIAGCSGGFGGFGKKDKFEDGFEFHRNTRKPISSTTRFDAAAFSGTWLIRGEFTHPGHDPLFGAVTFEHSGGMIRAMVTQNKVGGRDRYDVSMPAPGRIVIGDAKFGTQYWVLWVDADYRTAAIGTPSGSFGWVIDRDAKGGADRIKAARDMLAFNGYNMSRYHER